MADDCGLLRTEQGNVSSNPCLIPTMLCTLGMVLGMHHYALDLVSAFFSLPLVSESQDQLAFTWERQQ